MKIELHKITVEKLCAGFVDNAEEGVRAYGGKLDVRPPYQREFIYKDKQRNAVIDTVHKNFPLNVMYWSVRDDGNYEIIDGQQRTLSLCQYVAGEYSLANLYFNNLADDERRSILDYECMIYFCSGTDSERLEWFRTINIAGVKLSEQELRNAVYAGPWTNEAKKYFSKRGCPAYQIASEYLSGEMIRQEYLETAIEWHAEVEGIKGADAVEEYMGRHQHDPSAIALWNHFRSVIDWTKATFPAYRKEMKGVAWGPLYNAFKDKKLDAKKLDKEIARLMEDEDVTSKPGIYPFVLDGDESHLNIRAFTPNMKREAYERQKGICPRCTGPNKKKKWELDEMEADHIKPWSEGGKTDAKNCQMLCKHDNRVKSNV
ncbi:MAG: DUF262 domain-containing protein [Phycisphaerales bacterium]|nr:DUF262 domain-containing protein [Phycisphaerales bacterium]